MSAGMMLTAALAGSVLGRYLRLPLVTAYLLVGLAMGPSLLNAIPKEQLERLKPLSDMAMALVLFTMGSQFRFTRYRRIWRRAIRLSLAELGMTFALVAGGLLLVESWHGAVVLGAMALATAPATTILVFKEASAEGPLTETATLLVALNNLAAVVAFEVILCVVQTSLGTAPASILDEFHSLLFDLLYSIALGLIGGLVVSYFSGLWRQERWLVLLVAVTALLLGICLQYDVSYLLTFLTMGVVVANASDRSRDVAGELDRVTGLLCVIFFVIHGAEMDLVKLWNIGYVGVAYIALRMLGKWVGPFLAADPHKDGSLVKRYLGATLWAQAGMAIVLAGVASKPENGLGDLGSDLQTVILGTVVFFEILGPLAIRGAVYRAGELPLSQVIRHWNTTPLEELKRVLNRLAASFGFNPWRGRPTDEIKIEQLMKRSVVGIPAGADFDKVADFIEHSRDNTFPVVDQENRLVGIIRYTDLRDALFDPELGHLVCAADLAAPVRYRLTSDQSVSDALEMFRRGDDDCVPVVEVSEEAETLVGLIKRRDLFHYFLKSGAAVESDSSSR